MLSLSSCVFELGVDDVERNALARTFQCTKENWISSSESKVMIIGSCRYAFDGFWFMFDIF